MLCLLAGENVRKLYFAFLTFADRLTYCQLLELSVSPVRCSSTEDNLEDCIEPPG